MLGRFPDSFITHFWSKVDIQSVTNCWLWTACRLPNGYGAIRFNGQKLYAHRTAYIVTHGTISEGLQVLHKCRMRACCNPSHLYAGTPSQNMRDRIVDMRNAGEKPNAAKVTAEQVLRILADPRTYQKIAADYNITASNVCLIKTGKSRVDITRDFNAGGTVHTQDELDRVRDLLRRETAAKQVKK